jgi:hypothetical protein
MRSSQDEWQQSSRHDKAAQQVEALGASRQPVPKNLRQRAALAGRSSKGGQLGLNRFKARVRHFFNWSIAQGYRDDTPLKRYGVNVVRLNGSVEGARARRLQPERGKSWLQRRHRIFVR